MRRARVCGSPVTDLRLAILSVPAIAVVICALLVRTVAALSAENATNATDSRNTTGNTSNASNATGGPVAAEQATSPFRPYSPPARFCYTCGTTFSAGYYHTCGVEANGTMRCWGSNKQNQTAIPGSYVRFEALRNASGANRTWSVLYDYHREILDPETGEMSLFNFSDPDLDFSVKEFVWRDIRGWKSVSCGYSHTCAITDTGVILCWGQGKNQQALLPQWIMEAADIEWRQVSCGTGHSCAITMNGTAACWGANDEGQIDIPTSVANWSSISCGYAHTCGVAGDGSGHCWGWNGVTPGGIVPYGQCNVPDSHYNNNTWRHITAGFVHSCGVDSLGAGHCWGAGANGQLQVPAYFETAESQTQIETPHHHAPAHVPARWKMILASYYHTCGLTINSSVVCWGNNDATQLNVPPATLDQVRMLSSGFVHNCVMQHSGPCPCLP